MSDITRERQLRAVTFGDFDPSSLGISLHNMESLEKEVNEDLDRIEQLRMSDILRKVLLSEEPEVNVNDLLKKHHKKYEFYQRVKIHEKTHWYQHLSSTLLLSRFIAREDHKRFIRDAIDGQDLSDRPVSLPLIRWASKPDCPVELADCVNTIVQMDTISDLIEGVYPVSMPVSKGQQILSFVFPDLVNHKRFWETDSYLISSKALLEGAAKASEWIYVVKNNKSREKAAISDITNSSPIYNIAINSLKEAIQGLSGYEYLQLLSVLVEFSVNPLVTKDMWPYLWSNSVGEVKGEDVLPGLRYQRLVELFRSRPSVDFKSKQSIYNFLIEMTSKEYGWSSPQNAIKEFGSLIKNTYTYGIEESDHLDIKIWDPLKTIKRAIQIKVEDPLAFVSPNNHKLINKYSDEIIPIIVSGSEYYGCKSKLYTYILRQVDDIFMNDLLYNSNPACPKKVSPRLLNKFDCDDNCRFDDSKQSHCNASELEKCTVTSSRLRSLFGENIFSRLQYI